MSRDNDVDADLIMGWDSYSFNSCLERISLFTN